jgi:leucyl aminopeptidase
MKELDRYKELPVNIVAAIPLAENSVSGESFRPSDIITAYTGQTVQITNTDAE